MKNRTKPAPAVTPHQYTAEEFIKRYQDLCKETGLQIVFEPRWVLSKDNGDYRLVILSQVAPTPNDNV